MPASKELPIFLPVKDTAHELGISVRGARYLIAQKKLRVVKHGRRTLVRGESVLAYARTLADYEPRAIPGLKGHKAAAREDVMKLAEPPTESGFAAMQKLIAKR